MSERLTTSEGLKVGDVLVIAVELPDRQRPGHTFWWKRFACVVTHPFSRSTLTALTLKPKIDPDKDLRFIDITRDVVTKLEPDQWPQGVVAMRMKYIMQGVIKLDG